MMMNGRKVRIPWTKSCYGVDRQGKDLVVVLAERSRGRVTCTTVSSDDPAFADGIQNGIACVGCLSSRESFTRWVEAPFASLSRARKVFPTILDIQLPFALEDCVYCFLGAETTREKTTRALAVAARVTDVERKLELLGDAGIDPVALDQEGLALWTQSLRELPGTDSGPGSARVIIYMGPGHWTAVIGQGGGFLSAHSVKPGDTGRIGRLLQARLKPEVEGQKLTVRWAWTGPGAGDSRLVSDLEARLSVDWPGSSVVHTEPGAFLARALASRAMVPGTLRCNLRGGTFTHPEIVRKSRRQTIKTAVLFLTAGALVCGVNLAARELARKKEARIDRAFGVLVNELAGYDVRAKGEHALKIASERVNKRVDLLNPFLGAFEPRITGAVASIMEIGKQHDLRYEVLSVSRNRVVISGTAGDWNTCAALSAYLRNAGFLVELDRKEAMIDERIPFAITSGSAYE